MVRALLAGTKTQTRRELHPQPSAEFMPIVGNYYRTLVDQRTGAAYPEAFARYGASDESEDYPCPYGAPGDRLWVREEHHISLRDARTVAVRYLADGATVPEITIGPREHALFVARKQPAAVTRARFMWRCLSRIQLEITDVRAERLRAITEADAKAEGVVPAPENHTAAAVAYIFGAKEFLAHTSAYATLWEQLNGPGSWALNPWVWVLTFRRIA